MCYIGVRFPREYLEQHNKNEREQSGVEMSGKNVFYHRTLCLLITLLLFAMGMHVDEIHMDSPLECVTISSVRFQKVSSGQETVLYREHSVFSQLEDLIVLRASTRFSTGTRPVWWLFLCLIPSVLLFRFYIREKSVFLYSACDNQYRHRTLKYIHHKDGKKA